ncbi:MAG: hypothetical protein QMD07_00870 [Thermodesulfovibrionales bacterium]|nr:hypothetical protein [Thermodesulfovibrionales bacterium]
MKRFFVIGLVLFFWVNIIVPCMVFGQAAATVMTLADGTKVSMTSAQLAALTTQPGITIASTATVTATQVAIPIPAALGSGYIVGTPAAIAKGLGAAGIATGVTASGVVGVTAAAGTMTAGAMAGTVATLGVAGTVGAGAVIAGAVVGGIAAATSGATTTTHH